MRRELATDSLIAAITDRQGGVVGRQQLLELGLGESAIDRRLRAGRLHSVHRAVYSVGHRVLGVDGRRWAAVLACGPCAAVSHRTSAAAWGIRSSASATIDITIGPTGRVKRPGIRLHRQRYRVPDEFAHLGGLPITTPARTLLDLAAGGLRERPLEAALDRAEWLRLIDFAELKRLLARYPTRSGSPSLQALLSRYAAGSIKTRSVLEELALKLCDAHGLPRPKINCSVEGKVRDFYWPGCRLVVEADSYAWHRSPSALNDDRERDVRLMLRGYRSLRFTWEQVTQRREYVAGALLRALLRVGVG